MQCNSAGTRRQGAPLRGAAPTARASSVRLTRSGTPAQPRALSRGAETPLTAFSGRPQGSSRHCGKSRFGRTSVIVSASGDAEVLSYSQYANAGISVLVGKSEGNYLVVVMSDKKRPGLKLHWGVDSWALPLGAVLPPGTEQVGEGAVQTPFRDGESVTVAFPQALCPSKLVFVLKEGEQWINDGGSDFTALLKPVGGAKEKVEEKPKEKEAEVPKPLKEVLSRTEYEGGMAVVASRANGRYQVDVTSETARPDLVMHWGVEEWKKPAEEALPAGSVRVGDAVQTPFKGGKAVSVSFPEATCPSKLVFVLKEGEAWLKNKGADFVAELKAQKGTATGKEAKAAAPPAATAPAPPPAPKPEPEPRAEVLSSVHYEAGISVLISKTSKAYVVDIVSDKKRPDLKLHWGVNSWELPNGVVLPSGTVQAGDKAMQTPFKGGESVTLTFQEPACPSKLVFVLKEGDNWVNNKGADFVAELKPSAEGMGALPRAPVMEELSKQKFEEGLTVVVSKGNGTYQVEVNSDKPRKDAVLHWAVDDWALPLAAVLPPGTVQAGEGAVQTPLKEGKAVKVTFPEAVCPSKLVFVVKEGEQWIKNKGADFVAELKRASPKAEAAALPPQPPQPKPAPEPAPAPAPPAPVYAEPELLSWTHYEKAGVSVVVGRGDGLYLLDVTADKKRPDLVLHWGVDSWQLPAQDAVVPPGTKQAGESALQTPFEDGESVTIAFPEATCPSKLVFVLKEGEAWINDSGSDFTAQLKHSGSKANGYSGGWPAEGEGEVLNRTHIDAGIFAVNGNGANGNGHHNGNGSSHMNGHNGNGHGSHKSNLVMY